MPTNRVPLHRSRGLDFYTRQSLEYGDERGHEVFADDDARRAAWALYRDVFMSKVERCPGWRPQAWWDYEAPIAKPRDLEYHKAALWDAGLLSPQEIAVLEKDWRARFENAQRPDFQHCIGHDSKQHCAVWAKGIQAKRAHYRWAGIPNALIEKWTAEYKRRSKTIRKLAKPAPASEPVRDGTASEPPAETPPDTPLVG
jgi:hypothetical protein